MSETAGHQAERTVLAHWRTGLAAVVVAVLAVRESAPGAERALVAAAAILSTAAIAATLARRQRRLLAGDVGPAGAGVAVLALAVAVLQLAALAVVV